MPAEDPEGLDRRDFMMATLVSVGASAALAADAGPAKAQGARTAGAGGTVFTGDVIQGKPVVSALDLGDLAPGKHLLYFQGVQMPTGQHWHVSLIVAKGARPGKRLLLVSGVHGDEMSPVRTVQTVMDRLDPSAMAGSVLAVLDVSRPALEAMARRWPDSGRGAGLIDLNREWPGNENGASAPSRHAGLLFNRLMQPNADYAIDFHTAATGMEITAFHLARMDIPEVKAMAELYPVDQIFDFAAYPGVLSNALIDAGIPAFVPEIGAPRILDPAMIARFVEGTMNVLKHHGIIAGEIGRTARDAGVFIANSGHAVLATHGGFVELKVGLNDAVEPGQRLAVQRNAFGEVVAEYQSPVSGEIAGFRSDATAEPGTPLISIFYNAAPTEAPVDYAE